MKIPTSFSVKIRNGVHILEAGPVGKEDGVLLIQAFGAAFRAWVDKLTNVPPEEYDLVLRDFTQGFHGLVEETPIREAN